MKRLGVANTITLLRMTFIPVFLVFLLGQFGNNPVWVASRSWIAAGVFIVLAVTDVVDGYVARTRNEVTTFGKFIDPLADKLLVTAALVGLVQLGDLPGWIAIIIISRELIVSGLRLVAVAEGKVIAASAWGKAKTVLQVIALVAFMVKDAPAVAKYLGAAGSLGFTYLAYALMAVAIALTIVSAIDYFMHARTVIAGPWSGEQA